MKPILAHSKGDVTAPLPSQPPQTLTMAELTARVDARGMCTGTANDAWHPEDDPTTDEGRADYEATARGLCRGCPVQDECLILALRTEARRGVESHGIWGGTAPWERKRMLRRIKVRQRRATRRVATFPEVEVSA